MKDPKPGDIVEVSWDDHGFDFGPYSKEGAVRVTTVGYLVEDTPDVVAVALSRNPSGFHEVQTIDRRMLVRVRLVRKERS